MAATLGKAALLELDRVVTLAGASRPSRPENGPNGCKKLLRRLQTEYAETWGLQSMCKVAHMGRTHLSQLVKERTGDSPLTHLNRLRVAKARELLRHTERSVTEIAFGCGFHSSQYLARKFRQFTGKTPREYRFACLSRQRN
jgi:transcriptional regulator GlxA family with amidase domain